MSLMQGQGGIVLPRPKALGQHFIRMKARENDCCPIVTQHKVLTYHALQAWDSNMQFSYIVSTKNIFLKTNIEMLSLAVPNARRPYIFVPYVGASSEKTEILLSFAVPLLSQVESQRLTSRTTQVCSKTRRRDVIEL